MTTIHVVIQAVITAMLMLSLYHVRREIAVLRRQVKLLSDRLDG